MRALFRWFRRFRAESPPAAEAAADALTALIAALDAQMERQGLLHQVQQKVHERTLESMLGTVEFLAQQLADATRKPEELAVEPPPAPPERQLAEVVEDAIATRARGDRTLAARLRRTAIEELADDTPPEQVARHILRGGDARALID